MALDPDIQELLSKSPAGEVPTHKKQVAQIRSDNLRVLDIQPAPVPVDMWKTW